jgi:hypothetical protein
VKEEGCVLVLKMVGVFLKSMKKSVIDEEWRKVLSIVEGS